MNQRGFTLVELLISVIVIIVIGGIGTNAYVSQLERGRDQERQADLGRIQAALERYRADNGQYPSKTANSCDTSTGSCPALPFQCNDVNNNPCLNSSSWDSSPLVNALVPDYLESMPVDPKNNDKYFYNYSPVGGGGGAANVLSVCGKRIECSSSSGFNGACGYLLRARLETGTSTTYDLCNP